MPSWSDWKTARWFVPRRCFERYTAHMSTPQTLLIHGGHLIDPANNLDQPGNLLLEDGRVAAVLPPGDCPHAKEKLDAAGRLVTPGLIDLHVHLREPGQEEKETIASGTAAAVAGGFTAVACMPNTQPPLDSAAQIDYVLTEAQRVGHCRVYPIGAITKNRAGQELAELGAMAEAGAVAFSDDGSGVPTASAFARAIQYATMFHRPLLQHAEDASLATGVMNAGFQNVRLGLPGSPAVAEELMILRDLALLRAYALPHTRYHVLHISTAGGIEAVRQAKRAGLPVTTEVCPHHLLLTDEVLSDYDTNYKMSPPLRSPQDRQACLKGVKDGTIDCLVTDHAPHLESEKELEFTAAPFGILGLEAALGLFAKALVEPKHLVWGGPDGLIAKMSANPARCLNLPGGNLAVGQPADVTVIQHTGGPFTLDTTIWKSKSRNSPWHGWQVPARPVATIVAGKIVWRRGE